MLFNKNPPTERKAKVATVFLAAVILICVGLVVWRFYHPTIALPFEACGKVEEARVASIDALALTQARSKSVVNIWVDEMLCEFDATNAMELWRQAKPGDRWKVTGFRDKARCIITSAVAGCQSN